MRPPDPLTASAVSVAGLSRRLPNREYLIPTGECEEAQALLGLADVLFAYAYDHRTTGGDPTVESAWTVATLSPLLSWLEVCGETARANAKAIKTDVKMHC